MDQLTPAGRGDPAGPVAAQEPMQLLWPLLADRAALYTAGGSTSLPVETVRELFLSVLCTLGLPPSPTPADCARLAGDDLPAAFRRGIARLQNRSRLGKQLWLAACRAAPPHPSFPLRETLRSIGAGFARYDIQLAAHLFPCSIDYPLCLPPPEDPPGIEYINEWLRRLLAEEEFLARFPPAAVSGLLAAAYPRGAARYLNLFEPAAANALGLALLGANPLPLALTPAQRNALARRLEALSPADCRAALAAAADALAGRLRLTPAAARYLAEAAQGLFPRLRAAPAGSELSGLFIAFGG